MANRKQTQRLNELLPIQNIRKLQKLFWWVLRGSNPRHSPCKGDALPAELSTRSLLV